MLSHRMRYEFLGWLGNKASIDELENLSTRMEKEEVKTGGNAARFSRYWEYNYYWASKILKLNLSTAGGKVVCAETAQGFCIRTKRQPTIWSKSCTRTTSVFARFGLMRFLSVRKTKKCIKRNTLIIYGRAYRKMVELLRRMTFTFI